MVGEWTNPVRHIKTLYIYNVKIPAALSKHEQKNHPCQRRQGCMCKTSRCEDGQLLILPSESEEAGGLSSLTLTCFLRAGRA